MENLMGIIIVTMGIAIVVNVFLKKHHIPPIIGYIFSGLLISQIFGLSGENSHILHEVAEFGIVFLMFTIALEFSISHLNSMRREVLLHGGLQVTVSMAVFSAISFFLFGIDAKTSLIIGAALALSSTAIVLKIFNEGGEISRSYGFQSLGILLFQDLAVIPILLMISLFTNTEQSIGFLIGKTIVSAALILVILYVIGKYVIHHFLAWVTDSHSHEIFIASILFIVFSSSMLAHFFGFSYSLGAFFAGLLIAETKFKYQIEADLTPFRDILLGIFFVTVGMQIELSFLFHNIHSILAVMSSIMVIKFFIIFAILYFATDKVTSLKTAIALSQVGEFSFAVFELARTYGLIEHSLNQLMVISVIFSMVITPFMLKNLARIVSLMRFSPLEEKIPEVKVGEELKYHIVVCGYSHLGRTIIEKIEEEGLIYIGIENHRKLVEGALKKGHKVLLGNAAQRTILEKVNIKEAIAVIIAIEDEQKIRLVSESITAYAKHANIIVKVSDKKMFAALEDLPIHNLIDQHDEVASIMVKHALSCQIDRNKIKN
ncbi:MAG: cation:proton antiporter [Nitrospinae bacterium]|nr:cation:proton antiporter [Nitrospinota bacterium]